MNRAQRRVEERKHRPGGHFFSELQRQSTNRAYAAALREQMIREANGEPVHPEVLAGMTKPRETEDLFQVGVTQRETKEVKFLGPMMGGDAIASIVAGINKQILSGQRADWTHAEAYPMTRVQGE